MAESNILRSAGRGVLHGLILSIGLLIIWALIAVDQTGGWWVPADGMGSGDGYWMIWAPPDLGDDHIHIKQGSVSEADGGSRSRLETWWSGGEHPNRYCRIFDNHRNFRDAMGECQRNDPTRLAQVIDYNGVGDGGNSKVLDWTAQRHVAYENPDRGGMGPVSCHWGCNAVFPFPILFTWLWALWYRWRRGEDILERFSI
jgi:hypothetical protein